MSTTETDVRLEVIRYIMRIIDFGKGHSDPELDELTLGQMADRIIALVTSSAESEGK